MGSLPSPPSPSPHDSLVGWVMVPLGITMVKDEDHPPKQQGALTIRKFLAREAGFANPKLLVPLQIRPCANDPGGETAPSWAEIAPSWAYWHEHPASNGNMQV